MNKSSAIVLTPEVSFVDWESDLQAALIKKSRLAHVFHDFKEIQLAFRPSEPIKGENQTDDEFSKTSAKYAEELARWKEGEIEAKNVLLRRLSPSVCPQNFRRMSAKQIFDTIATTREESAAIPYETAVRNSINTKFTTIEEYCDKFMQHYLSVNSAAESMYHQQSISDSDNPYTVHHGLASFLFVLGTESVDWLDTWRQTKILDGKNRYVPLESMMSMLRQVGQSKGKSSGQLMVMTGEGERNDGGKKKAVGVL